MFWLFEGLTLVFLINVQARLFFGGSISPLHTHFYLVPARLLGTTYILIRPTLPISRLHAYLNLHLIKNRPLTKVFYDLDTKVESATGRGI